MKKQSLFIIGLVLLAMYVRMTPHPWNFTPILAVCIFCGYKIKPIGLAIFLPLLSIFLGDLYIGIYNGISWVYGAYIGTIALAIVLIYFGIEFLREI